MNFKGKNVLLVIHQGYLGGAERQGLSLSKVLTEEYECNVYLMLTYSAKMTLDFQNFANECKVKKIYHFGTPYFLLKNEFNLKNLKRLVWSFKYLFKIKRGVKGLQPDIIIPFLNFPSKISYYLYKFMPSVKITFWHQLGLDTWSDDIFEKLAAKNTPVVIANAPNGLDIFNSKYKRSKGECFVLPQFVSLDYIAMDREELRKKYGIATETIVIGMIAHYRPEKLHDLLIQTFIHLNTEFPNLALIFLGDENGRRVNVLKQKVLDLQMSHKISILSNHPVPEVLHLADIGVLVSEIEGVPNAVMEYMQFGLPVVCTDHPGCKILLDDSRFLIRNEIEQLYSRLKDLILSKKLRETEGEKNLRRIKDFEKTEYVKDLERILSKTLEHNE